MEVLLGLLTIEPMSGYDLGLTIRGSVGFFWNESYGQIYPNLRKLEGGGFVTSTAERQNGRPDRRIYSITEQGRERLRKWLAVPPQPEIPRNELLLKLFFGEQAPPEILIEYVERMAEERRGLLKLFEQSERDDINKNQHYSAAPYWRMAARFGQIEMKAHVHWAEETLTELKKIAGNGRHSIATQREKRRADKKRSHRAK
jgi:PadR family transcriptional regulator AphA